MYEGTLFTNKTAIGSLDSQGRVRARAYEVKKQARMCVYHQKGALSSASLYPLYLNYDWLDAEDVELDSEESSSLSSFSSSSSASLLAEDLLLCFIILRIILFSIFVSIFSMRRLAFSKRRSMRFSILSIFNGFSWERRQ